MGPPRKADAPESSRWVPPGERVVIAGRELKGGLFYVGKGLRAVNGSRGLGGSVEPALINPELRVGRSSDKSGEGMGYWPSYSDIPPECRAAYLDWLQTGREDAQADIGYVFLFFYGLERRALFDLSSEGGGREEWRLIAREVERLRALHGSNASFRGYSTSFLGALAVLQGASGEISPSETSSLDTGAPSLAVLYAVSRCARDGGALPSGLALAWALGEMQTPLRTPATRCPREFQELFRLRYAKEFGEGLVVAPLKSTLRATYRPASASFGGEVVLPTGNLPRPSTQPLRRISALIDECTQALDPYSRWVGRNGEKGVGLAAAALLPTELAMALPHDDIQALRQELTARLAQAEYGATRGEELLRHWPSTTPGKLNKNESVLLMQSMEKLGFGVEPDIQWLLMARLATKGLGISVSTP